MKDRENQNIIQLDKALKKLGLNLAEEVLEIVEENREKNNLTFEQAAIGVKNLNDNLVKKWIGPVLQVEKTKEKAN